MWLEAIVVNFLIHTVPKISGFVNLAHTPAQSLQGTASWSVVPHGNTNWTADKAVDGNTNQTYNPTCAIAAYDRNYISVWWKVWLKRKFNIAYLDVYLRSGTTGRATGFSIYIYDDVSYVPPSGNTGRRVYHHNPMSGCPVALQNITVNKLAQGVAFYNERPHGFTSGCSSTDKTKTSVEICEVRVMGCDERRYHFGCSRECNDKCKDKHCDAFNGSCIYGCSDPNAVSLDCIVCDDGKYAFNGRCEPCGHCQGGMACNKETGRCPSGCKENWSGYLCKECADGFYGENCSTQCGNCLEGHCDKTNGGCSSGCQLHWKEPLCQECVDGYYDQNCNTQCGNCREGFCHKKNGSCLPGCKLNWKKPLCQECVDGYYGQNCSTQCGNCQDGHCDKTTGHCSSGCKLNWKEPFCQECVDGNYGRDCSTKCGNCREGFCDKKNGSCLSGCKGNWKEPLCQECVDGYYDQNCRTQCGNCLTGFCDKINGSCQSGCKGNWNEPLCQECVDGFYDEECSTRCGHCLTGVCDKTNGTCMSGCSLNWKDPFCQECIDGFYNQNCSNQCGNCQSEFCDKKNGSCIDGCKTNWKEPLCQECSDGMYDQNCSTKCGHCLEGFCDKTNGNCLTGCKLNWKEPLCKQCVDGFYDGECNKHCGQCLRGVCDKTNGNCMSGCSPNWQEPLCQECTNGSYGKNCSTQCENCLGDFCDKKNGTCLTGCKTNWHGALCQVSASKQEDEENDTAIIGGTVPAVLIAVFVGVIILIIYRRHRNNGGKEGLMEHDRYSGRMADGRSSGKDKETEFFDGVCNPGMDQTDENGYYNTVQFITNINIGDLRNVINEKSTGENNQFVQEYKRLPPANLNACQSAKKTENVAKNRFKTTFPYEHSRIILKEMWTDSDNDYINASFISDCKGENRYIAAQGPKNNTLKDFWRMIWQENITDIIMLTNIVENGKNKCTQYWPDKGKSMQIGLCNISLREETVYAFHTVRKLSVERKQPPSKRIITHFHYTAWPDHGTPQEVELVQFHRFVSKRIHTDVPLLVHCSAGVGRTGTFIGLDSLLTQGRETGRIKVFEFVKQMRENRMTMVQTPEQYVFLHEALDCGFQGDFRLTEDEFPTKMAGLLNDSAPLNQRALYKEFKLLDTLKPDYSCLDTKDARNAENTNKNYSKDILPVAKYRAYLSTYVSGRNDYINAVIVPSYIDPSGLIITQKPFQNTEVDLWRLCVDHEVNSLLVINAKDEANDWLPKRGLPKASIPFTITFGDTGSNIGGVSQDELVISSDDVKKEIEVFQVHGDDDNALVKATELVLEMEKKSPFTSVVISKDGAGPAGIFCVLHNALQQISMDGEVDIFTIVRELKARRPEVITKLEEYRRCYQLVSQSFSAEGIYANM